MSSQSRERQISGESIAAPSYDESHEDEPLKPSKPSSNPLPREFWFVILIMWAEPICGTVIYPFINALVRETGVTHGDEAKTGYYAGVIVRHILPAVRFHRHTQHTFF